MIRQDNVSSLIGKECSLINRIDQIGFVSRHMFVFIEVFLQNVIWESQLGCKPVVLTVVYVSGCLVVFLQLPLTVCVVI